MDNLVYRLQRAPYSTTKYYFLYQLQRAPYSTTVLRLYRVSQRLLLPLPRSSYNLFAGENHFPVRCFGTGYLRVVLFLYDMVVSVSLLQRAVLYYRLACCRGYMRAFAFPGSMCVVLGHGKIRPRRVARAGCCLSKVGLYALGLVRRCFARVGC
jgi:hypothetical protein